ncbi:[NiFe] hydrogenase metallocenter assembly protein HypF [Rhodovulum sp. PH10]|uniref:carbamoyltransferase HypF n=1 Tax=Rhodovulum sp. PH10 TaxID=1187851 RepID=UPI00027C22FF|nr:carbamoyltransferase HypF [Rhodovulum sp. PH10]EJW13195.1 [NiFe] hydrogenase metallocenter assembly protein HypF [Rhodovulum sp. PH10]
MSGRQTFDPGVVRIVVGLAGRRIVSVRVAAERPRGLGAVVAGRPPQAVPPLVRRLFALCGESQSVAAAHALRMAGADIAPADPLVDAVRLAAERLAEHLRGLVIGWGAAVPLEAEALAAVRTALAGNAAAPADILRALRRLGIGAGGPVPVNSWAERLLAQAEADAPGLDAPPDPLSAADDAAVLAALFAEGEVFSAAPRLTGRRPQTGPAARAAQADFSVKNPATAAGRLFARFTEIAEAAALLAHPRDPGWVTAGRLADGVGYAAVESPRGRLYHLVTLDRSGQVARHLVLAPTEWNFADGGPFAAALEGLAIGEGDAKTVVGRLASLFDPCVGTDVTIAEQPRGREEIRLRGVVQGVGMRPFVFGLAEKFGLAGSVRNDAEGVLIDAEGFLLDAFADALLSKAPPLARIDALERTPLPLAGAKAFVIEDSVSGSAATRIAPDAATCEACLDELFDPDSRFHLYPFVNCTHCGPRYTITRRIPYDRPNTAMAGFAMCPACAAAYRNPRDRRFHAEPIACPVCGPRLGHPVEEIAAALREGKTVALKGIGGFHLMCDATNETAVSELRRRKAREAKPFAVMVANAASLDLFASAADAHRDLITTPARPIVLMPLRDKAPPGVPALAPSVTPNLSRVGMVLPYAPVHHLLFHALLGAPQDTAWREAPQSVALLATSANPGGEPLVVDDADAARRLSGIADLIVTHDRPIVVRADDSVMTVVDGAPAFLRRARGFVPDPVDLGTDGPCVLAVGAHLKTTVTVTRGREAFVSQHIGDLDTAETVRFYRETVAHLLAVLDVRPETVVCDLHPDYRSTRFAEETGLPLLRVQHHAAHIAAIAAEHGVMGPLLGVALDGHGIGEIAGKAGGNWGGELMRLDGFSWQRLGHLAPLALPGGDRAAREPWRMALAALAAVDRLDEAAARFPSISIAKALAARVSDAPVTTSLGRLFDAAAGLLGVRTHQDYEGQAAMELEALVETPRVLKDGFVITNGVLDVSPLLAALADQQDRRTGAEMFHGTLIDGITTWIAAAAKLDGSRAVALGGGCLMNKILAEGLADALRTRGLTPLLARKLPPNDGGLSLGQAAMARAME